MKCQVPGWKWHAAQTVAAVLRHFIPKAPQWLSEFHIVIFLGNEKSWENIHQMSIFSMSLGPFDNSCTFQAYGSKSYDTEEESANWHYAFYPTAECPII